MTREEGLYWDVVIMTCVVITLLSAAPWWTTLLAALAYLNGLWTGSLPWRRS